MSDRSYPVLYALALTVSFLLLFTGNSRGTTVDRILATIDDQVITLADYKLFNKGLKDKLSDDSIDEKVLRELMEEKVIALEAKRRGMEAPDGEVEKMIEVFKAQNNLSGDDLETFLKDDGIDLGKFRTIVRERILISQILSSDVDAKVLITEQELEEFYVSRKREFIDNPEYVELNAIFFLLRENSSLTEITDMKRRALRIVALLREGDNFERLVDEYSDEPLRSHKGALGKFARGALIPPLDRKAFAMKEGEISDPIWVGDGVFILQLIRRSDEAYKPLDQVKKTVYDALFRQKREKVFNDWIKALWEKASVKIYQS
jgi:peptidyl-prolyl cis-trans isomerase SurA